MTEHFTPEARDFYIKNFGLRYEMLTLRDRRRLYDLDSTIAISVRRLAVGPVEDPGAPYGPLPHEGLDSPKPRRSPWFWPVVSLSAFLIIVLGGTFASLFL